MTTASPVAQETDTDMNDNGQPQSGVNTSWRNAPTRTVTAGGVDYAYRELGPKAGVPVIFLVHLAGTLDNWDPPGGRWNRRQTPGHRLRQSRRRCVHRQDARLN